MSALPVPEPVAFPRESWRVVLAQHESVSGRFWHAEIEVDGEVWTLDCSHLHQRANLAARCVPKLRRRFETLLADYEASLVQRDPYPIVEFARTEIRNGGRMTWSQRATPSQQIVRVLDADEVRARLKRDAAVKTP